MSLLLSGVALNSDQTSTGALHLGNTWVRHGTTGTRGPCPLNLGMVGHIDNRPTSEVFSQLRLESTGHSEFGVHDDSAKRLGLVVVQNGVALLPTPMATAVMP